MFEKPAASVPLLDLTRLHEPLFAELDSAFREVVGSSQYIGGSAVRDFERAFATYLEAGHCVGMANGTDALEIALEALGISAGDAVLVPDLTFVATAEAVLRVGATPVFADVDAPRLTVTRETLQAAWEAQGSERIRALIVVHLHGNPAPMDEICTWAAEKGLKVVEDCAQSHGATHRNRKTGTFGDAATFSFFPGKNLGALGDAGAAVTSDPALADRMRMLANHGRKDKQVHLLVGRNSRLDSLQARFLSVKLKYLDEWNAKRTALAARYAELLGEKRTLTLPFAGTEGDRCVFHQFVLRTELSRDQRDAWIQRLREQGIDAGCHYAWALHQQPALEKYGAGRAFPQSETVAASSFSLPMDPNLEEESIQRVVHSMKDL